MGSRVLATLTSTSVAAIELFPMRCMTIAYESITLAVGTVKGDRHHEDSSFLNCLTFSEPIISCRFVPLPKFGYAAQTRAFSQALTIASTLFWLGTYLVQAGFTLAGGGS